MKTKKEILEWFKSKGNDMKNLNDYEEFTKIISKTIKYYYSDKINCDDGSCFCFELTSKRWKHSLYLAFNNDTGECFKIIGFY